MTNIDAALKRRLKIFHLEIPGKWGNFVDEEIGKRVLLGVAPLGDLKYGPYQRPEIKLAIQIGASFDPRAFSLIYVGVRANQDLFCVDGRQRSTGALMAKVDFGPAKFFESTGAKEEADLFHMLNAWRTAVSAVDNFRAALIGRNEFAVDIERVVTEAGFKISVAAQRPDKSWPAIRDVDALAHIYRRGGDRIDSMLLIRHTLGLIDQLWSGEARALNKPVLRAVSFLIWNYGVRWDDELVKLAVKRLRDKGDFDFFEKAARSFKRKEKEAGRSMTYFRALATEMRKRIRVAWPSVPHPKTARVENEEEDAE